MQGLADAFALLGLPFESADAAALNRLGLGLGLL